MVRKLALVLSFFWVFLWASDGFSSGTTNVNLSSASGGNNTVFTNGRWELKTDPSMSQRILTETRTGIEAGNHNQTELTPGSDPTVKLGLSLGGNGSDGTFDLSLGGAVGGCNGPGMTWTNMSFNDYAGYDTEEWSGPTCVINTNVKSVFNFTTVNIPQGTHVRATGSNALKIFATGNITINGVISVSAWREIPGAGGYGPAQGPGAGTSANGIAVCGWGELPSGAGHGGIGGSGFTHQNYSMVFVDGGSTYNDPNRGGSGGGNLTFNCDGPTLVAPGGAGGGAIFLESRGTIHIGSSGRIFANGGTSRGVIKPWFDPWRLMTDEEGCSWSCYLSGAGSGGRVSLSAVSISGDGQIWARGGDTRITGGNWPYGSGLGKGGGGRVEIKIYGTEGPNYQINVNHGAQRWNWSYNGGQGVSQTANLPLSEAPQFCNGTFTSQVYDLVSADTQKKWNYNASTPSGTSVQVRVRHGSTPQFDPVNWSDWLNVPSGSVLPMSGSRYFQYRVTLSGSGGSQSCTSSPQFGFVTVDEFGFDAGPGFVVTNNVSGVVPGLIESVTVNQNTPPNTNVKWAVSVDGGSWRKFSNGNWVDINSIENGNTAQELASIDSQGWRPLGVGQIRFAFSMTGNQIATPSVSGLSVRHLPIQVDAGSLTCPERLHRGAKGICSVTGSSNIGSLVYHWSGYGATFNPTGEGTTEVSFDSKGKRTVTVKVYVEGHPNVSVTRSANIEILEVPKPSVVIVGPTTVFRGQEVTYSLEVTCPGNFECTSELRIGGEIKPSPATFTVTQTGILEIVGLAMIKDLPDTQVESVRRVFVNEVRKPFVSISAPKVAEVGKPITLKATITAKYGTPEGHWILPDNTTVPGVELIYTPTEKTDSLVIGYKAWISGFPDTETTAQSRPIKVDTYEMPQFKIKSFLRNPQGFAPANIVLGVTGDMSKVIDFGVKLTHRWDLGDGTIREGESPKMVSHVYSQPGVYTVSLTVYDDRNNMSYDEYVLTVLEVPQLEVESFRVFTSNRFNRVPLNVFLRPNIKGGHPQLDRVFTYEWTVNGIPVSNQRVLSLNITEAGDYTIGLTVISKSGKTGYGEYSITAFPNEPPVCNITHIDYPKNKVTKFMANCHDPDGRITAYEWDLGNGVVSKSPTSYGKYETGGTYNTVLTVTDDSGDKAIFNYSVTVER